MVLDKPDMFNQIGESDKIKACAIWKIGVSTHPVKLFTKPTLIAHLLLATLIKYESVVDDEHCR